MITDANLLLSGSCSAAGVWTGQSIAAVASTIVSTNAIDTAPLSIGGNQAPGWGKGETLYAVFDILVAVLSGGSATVQFAVIESDSADLSSPQVLCETGLIGKADLTIGKQIILPIPRSAPRTAKRYLGVQYTIGTATTTAGTVIAQLVHDVSDTQGQYFASGFSIT